MTEITANDLKTKGVSVFEKALKQNGEAIITIRGSKKYVVLDFNTYNKLREYELDIAIQESKADLDQGQSHGDLQQHLQNVQPKWATA